MTFGDHDPEDTYDASDPVPVLLANVARRIEFAVDDLTPWARDEHFAVFHRLELAAADVRTLAERIRHWGERG